MLQVAELFRIVVLYLAAMSMLAGAASDAATTNNLPRLSPSLVLPPVSELKFTLTTMIYESNSRLYDRVSLATDS